jgi:beta-barrel assembly-enhancing protease
MIRSFSFPSRQDVGQRLGPQQSTSGSGCIRIVIALAVAAFALISFLGSKQTNPVTGQEQYISITQDQEIALGLQSTPEMEAQFGGLEPDQRYQNAVQAIGDKLVNESFASQSEYPFDFYVLADAQTVNAFALPGGPVFITRALMDLLPSEGSLASILAHEISHVVARHSAEQISTQQLTQGLTGAVVMATYDPNNPSSMATAEVAMLIGQLVDMKFSREDEIVADTMGVKVMGQANYDPNTMLKVMQILEQAGSGNGVEFLSTHPSPENRTAKIQQAITDLYPSGVPGGMIQ